VHLDPKAVEAYVDAIIKGGLVVMGAFGGAIFSAFVYSQANKWRGERDKIDAAERKELIRQLAVKDKRIDALHAKLSGKGKKTGSSGGDELNLEG